MKYLAPLDAEGENDSYTDGNPAAGVEGSIPPAAGFESVQREIVHVIETIGLVPDGGNLTQLNQAIDAKIAASAPEIQTDNVSKASTAYEGTVSDSNVCYFHEGNGEYTKAVYATNYPVAVADVSNGRVYFAGRVPTGLFTGLTPGSKYYLSETVPGEITLTAPATDAVEIGIAITSDEFYVDIDSAFSTHASETLYGLAKFADVATAIAGVATDLAVTPAGLAAAIPVAATNVSGKTAYATDTQAQAMDSAYRALTPSNLDALAATTSRKGLVELATNSQSYGASPSASLAVTPAGLEAALDQMDIAFTKYAQSGEYSLTLGGLITFSHGLGMLPKGGHIILVCKTTDTGWNVGDTMIIGVENNGGTSRGFAFNIDSSVNAFCRMPPSQPLLNRFSSGTQANITVSSWKVRLRVWA